MSILPRNELYQSIMSAIHRAPVTLLLGARQCGKTTIAKEIHRIHGGVFFDLEDPETPLMPAMAKTVLRDLTGLIIIDEFQRQPALFPTLRVLADRKPNPAKFLVLGSSSLDLVRGMSMIALMEPPIFAVMEPVERGEKGSLDPPFNQAI